jgi:signal transduction histidine kinase
MRQQTTEMHQIKVVTAEVTLPLDADRDRLTRVVSNLLSNAVKYSQDGGVILVSLTQEEAEGRRWVMLSVQDEGLGIPAAELPHIFERFRRASNVRGRIAGTGIGLAGAKQTVELHGGEMRVESVENKGTTVTMRLPLDQGISADTT